MDKRLLNDYLVATNPQFSAFKTDELEVVDGFVKFKGRANGSDDTTIGGVSLWKVQEWMMGVVENRMCVCLVKLGVKA